MRHWHPLPIETAKQVKAFDPDQVILLPLFPQFSVTTSGSCFRAWQIAATQVGLPAKTVQVCCYPEEPHFIEAHAQRLRPVLEQIEAPETLRVLFSAHSLPQRTVDAGDRYPSQVEKTVQAIARKLDLKDYRICYQSRVGPVKWLGPNLEEELGRAGAQRRSIAVVPVAFVSEHAETLIELDQEMREKAIDAGVVEYHRVPALGEQPEFIGGLASIVAGVLKAGDMLTRDLTMYCPHLASLYDLQAA